MKKTLLLISLLLLVQSARGTTYYASTSGSKTGAGTIGDPWDITAACTANALASGDTVYLRGGNYPAAKNFGVAQNSQMFAPATNGVTYHSYPGEWAWLYGDSTWQGWIDSSVLISVMSVLSADSVTMDSVGFKWGAKCAVYASGTPYGWRFTHCVFDSTPVPGHVSDNEGAWQQQTGSEQIRGFQIDSCTFTNTTGRGALHLYGMLDTDVFDNYFEPTSALGPGGAIFIKGGVSNNNVNFYNNEIKVNANCSHAFYVWAGNPVYNIRFYNNVIYGPVGDSYLGATQRYFIDSLNFDSLFFYNNTIDAEGEADEVFRMVRGEQDAVRDVDNIFFFNNIVYRPNSAQGYDFLHDDNNNNSVNGCCPVGDNLYLDYNVYVQRNKGDDIVGMYNSSNVREVYTLGEWRDTVDSWDATWTGDPNSDTTSDTTQFFTDRGNADYTIHANNVLYDFIDTAGRGGSWPTYIGAFDPSDAEPATPQYIKGVKTIRGVKRIGEYDGIETDSTRVYVDRRTPRSYVAAGVYPPACER